MKIRLELKRCYDIDKIEIYKIYQDDSCLEAHHDETVALLRFAEIKKSISSPPVEKIIISETINIKL